MIGPPRAERFVLGTAPLSGGMFRDVAAEQAHAIIEAAVSRGIRTFDTAPMYGLGEAERRLQTALGALDRRQYAIHTKVGRPIDGVDVTGATALAADFSRDAILRSVEGSIKRLGTSVLDVVHLHDPQAEDLALVLDEALPALAELRAENVLSAVGVASNTASIAARLVDLEVVDVVLCAGRFTLLDRSAERELLPAAGARGVPVLCAGVFNSGVLACPTADSHFDYGPVPELVLRQAQELAARCTEAGVSLRAAALQFPLRAPEVSGLVVGVESVAELDDDVVELRRPVPPALWPALDRIVEH